MSRPASVLEWSPGAAGPLFAEDDRWWHRAACLGADTEIFFARPDAAPVAIAEAKAFCAGCPVVAECLRDAAKTGDTHSVRGGLTGSERQAAFPSASPSCCAAGTHARTSENTYADGRCRRCKAARRGAAAAAERVARTGSSSPQSGRRAAA